MAIAAKLTAERGGKKLGEEIDCGSDDKKKKGEEEDPRSMKTKVNLVKNKLRAMGLKMSYEPEGEQIDEIAPLAIGAGLVGLGLGAKALSDRMKGDREKVTGGKVAPSSKPSFSDRRRETNAQMKDLMSQSYEPEGEVIDELNRSERETGINTKTGRPTQKGGDPRVKERNKPPLKYGGSRQEPKVRGEKPPTAGQPGSGVQSPAYKAALRRNARKRAAEFEMDTRGT